LAWIALVFLSLLLPSATLGRAAPAATAEWQLTRTLYAADGGAEHYFGNSITLQGNTAVIGAPGWDSAAANDVGAAYVFTNDGAGWVERTRLVAADGLAGERFGGPMDLDGNVLAVAAPDARRGNPGAPDFAYSAGAVYIFTGSGATWSQQAKLMPADLVAENIFGVSLDLNGDTLLVGAPDLGYGNEAVYFYSRQGNGWAEPVKFSGPDQTVDHDFGIAVAVAGDVALVGAPGINCCDPWSAFEKGVVYVFTRSGGVWSPAGTLMPSDGFPGDNFGCDIAFDGTTAVIAACQAYGLAEIHGYAYVFTRSGNIWTQTARLAPEGDSRFAQGIRTVSLAGDRLVLGSPNAPPDPFVGRLYPYVRQGMAWVEEATISSPNGQPNTDFGWSLALSAEHLLAGAAYLPNLNVPEQGGVYAFRRDEAGYTLYAPIIAAPTLESPEGLIAYYGHSNDEFDIFVIRPDGTGKTNLTRSADLEASPVWSPDGARLAFVQSRPGQDPQLVIADASGANRRVVPLEGDLGFIGSPAWSPDGTRLAFSAYESDAAAEYDIFVVNIDGSGLVNLTPALPGESSTPNWSPDGTKILFANVRNESGATRQLAVVAPNGGAATFLTDAERWHNDPDWSPDGEKIMFSSHADGGSGLFTMPAGGGEPTLLLRSATMGRWSPDGTQVVFIGDGGGLFRAKADGSGITTIDATPAVFSPDWQP
jgi:hypothetical protein